MDKNNITYNIVLSLISIFIGLITCIINPEQLLNFIFVIIGVVIIVNSVLGLYNARLCDIKERNELLVFNTISIIVGCILIFYPQTVALIIAGIVLIAIPVYRIITNKYHYLTFKKEISKLIIGSILITFGIATTMKIFFYVVGGLIILIGTVCLVRNIILLIKLNKKEKKQREDSEVIDV